MRFAVDLPISGEYSDAHLLSNLAREVEDAGWDGCFVWDHVQIRGSNPIADPWIALTAMALATRRIRLGPLVTPLFRRHPWKMARETVTLDHLSGGRLVLGVGLGDDAFSEISTFQGPQSARTRAEILEESLAIIVGLWSGNQFSFCGRHFQVKEASFLPRPLQMPRIPIWVAGRWPRKPPFRRAAQWDGIVPVVGNLQAFLDPRQIRELTAYIGQFRQSLSGFDVVQFGHTSGLNGQQDRELVAAYAEAGATWWCESFLPWHVAPEDARKRIQQGPPV